MKMGDAERSGGDEEEVEDGHRKEEGVDAEEEAVRIGGEKWRHRRRECAAGSCARE